MQPTPNPLSGDRGPRLFFRWPWPWLYFLLAAFDLCTVSISLYLNHRMMSIYRRSVEVNQAWASLADDSSELGHLAAAVNAPGNDVFASRQLDVEAVKLRRAEAGFARGLGEVREQARSVAGSDQRARLEGDLDAVEAATRAMAAEAGHIFELLRKDLLAEAGDHMARMDRLYQQVNNELFRLRKNIGEIQRNQFARQTSAASAVQASEYLVAVLILVMVAGAALYGYRVAREVRRSHEELERRVRERTADLEAANAERRRLAEVRAELLRQVISAQEEERRRLARDLHDEIGQSMISLLIGLRTAEDAPSAESARERVADLRQITSATLEDIRRLARGLHPAVLDDLGLEAALERFLADYARAHGIDARLHATGQAERRLPTEVETALYRIVQEALANVARHAAATSVEVRIDRQLDRVEITVRDNGRGFDGTSLPGTGPGGHLGLIGMRERATLVGGEVRVNSRPGQGTVVVVRIPLHSSARATEDSP